MDKTKQILRNNILSKSPQPHCSKNENECIDDIESNNQIFRIEQTNSNIEKDESYAVLMNEIEKYNSEYILLENTEINIIALDKLSMIMKLFEPSLLNVWITDEYTGKRYEDYEKAIQIHYINGHYVVSHQIKRNIIIYDTLYNEARIKQLLMQLRCIYKLLDDVSNPEEYIRYCVPQSQGYRNDCGAFAAAFAITLYMGEDPQLYRFEQNCLRVHLKNCIDSGKIEFPPAIKYKSNNNTEIKKSFMKTYMKNRRAQEDEENYKNRLMNQKKYEAEKRAQEDEENDKNRLMN